VSSDSNALPLPVIRRAAPGTARKTTDAESVIERAEELRRGLTNNFRDEAVSSIYAEAERISQRSVHRGEHSAKLD